MAETKGAGDFRELSSFVKDAGYDKLHRAIVKYGDYQSLPVNAFLCLMSLLAKLQLIKEGKPITGHPEPYRDSERCLSVTWKDQRAIKKCIVAWQPDLVGKPYLNAGQLCNDIPRYQTDRTNLLKAAFEKVKQSAEQPNTKRPSRLSLAQHIPDKLIDKSDACVSVDEYYKQDSGVGQEIEDFLEQTETSKLSMEGLTGLSQ